ncbi:hypothetical protein YC2023_045226 [Brassica napus]
METLMLKADLEEEVEATMARFQGGLNRDIQDRLELQEYEDMDELLHKAILIEQQNKRKSSTRSSYTPASKPAYSKEGPMTRARARKLKEAIGGLIRKSLEQEECLGGSLILQDTLITIQAILPSS